MPASSNVFRCARLRAIVKAFSPARVTPPCVGLPSLSLSLSLPIPPPHYGARVPWRSAADPQHAVRAAASSACAFAYALWCDCQLCHEAQSRDELISARNAVTAATQRASES